MSDKPGNPPAFALAAEDSHGRTVFQEGMSLRDYFAAAALTGMLSNTPLRFEALKGVDDAANKSYHLADAMLKARQS